MESSHVWMGILVGAIGGLLGILLHKDMESWSPILREKIIRFSTHYLLFPGVRERRAKTGKLDGKHMYDFFCSMVAESSPGKELTKLAIAFGSILAALYLNADYLKDQYVASLLDHPIRTILLSLFFLTSTASATYISLTFFATSLEQEQSFPIPQESPDKTVPPTEFKSPYTERIYATPSHSRYSDVVTGGLVEDTVTLEWMASNDAEPGSLNKSYLFTSESVSEGHPKKIADQISDAVFALDVMECSYCVEDLVLSADGTVLGAYADNNGDAVHIWVSATNGFTVLSDPSGGTLQRAVFNSDGSKLAAGFSDGRDGRIYVWDRLSGNVTMLPAAAITFDSAVNDLALSPDGTVLVSYADHNGDAVHVWDSATNGFTVLTDPSGGTLQRAVFNSDGSKLAAGFSDGRDGRDGRIYVWDRLSGNYITVTNEDVSASGGDVVVNKMSFNPAGDRLVIALNDGSVQLLDSFGNIVYSYAPGDIGAFDSDKPIIPAEEPQKFFSYFSLGEFIIGMFFVFCSLFMLGQRITSLLILGRHKVSPQMMWLAT